MTCPACGAQVERGARFCSECGHQLVSRHDERRVVTVLFADLVGFTTLSETTDPEQVKNLVDVIFEALAADVTAFGGRVDQVIGDAVIAIFGAPIAHEDDAERAVRAALKMQQTLGECAGAVGVKMRVGVNTGEVLVGALRAGGSITAMGDVVNTAQRLQVAAAPGAVVVGAATQRVTLGAVAYEPLGALRAKGREEPVEAFVATGTTRPPGHRLRRTQGPLVGRDDELALVSSAVATAVRRSRAQLVLLYGEAGVGKSRLAEDVGERARACHGATVLEGRCVPYGEANVWWPVAEAVRQACGIGADDPIEVAEERCERRVAEVLAGVEDVDIDAVVTGLVHLMGYETPLRGIDPQRAREEATRSVLSFLDAAGRTAPVVLLLSDLHWADEAVLGLIGPLLDRVGRRPVVLIATARHELEERWSSPPGRHNAISLTLDPLDHDAAAEMLASLSERDLPADLREALIDRSGGNPLFIEELVALVAQQGAEGEGDLPATLRGLISARIDALGPEERATLEDAAVWGGSGPVEALRRMAEARRRVSDVRPALEALVANDVLGVEGDHWAFRSDLVREVGYSMLTKAHRAQSHHGIAEYLEGVSPPPSDASDRTVDVVAHHYGRAAELAMELGSVPKVPGDVGARSLPWIEEAAHRASTAMVPPVALALQTSALRLLGRGDGARRAELLLARARTAAELRDLRTAEADVAEATAIAAELGDAGAAANALLAAGEIRLTAGDLEDAEAALGDALAAFVEIGDERGQAESLRQIGMVRIFGGRNDEAESVVDDALARFRSLGDRRGEAWALQNLAWIAYVQGRTSVAEDRIAVSAQTFEELGDRGGLGWALGLLAFVRYHQGEHEEAGRLGEQILEESHQRGDAWAEGMMLLLLAGVRMWSGRARGAVDAAERGLERFASIDDRFGQAQSLSVLARALVAVGRVPEAMLRLEEAQVRFAEESTTSAPVLVGVVGSSAFLGDPRRALAALAIDGDGTPPSPTNLGDGDRDVAHALALLQLDEVEAAIEALQAVCDAFEGDGTFPYAESVLALALAAAGRHEEVVALAASVRAAARATYLDRATADLAEGLSRVATTGDGLAELQRLTIDLGATDDVLAQAVAEVARAMACEALDDPAALDAADAAEARLAELGVPAHGWRTVFARILGTGSSGELLGAAGRPGTRP